MRNVKTLMVALVAVFAFSAVAASAASAQPAFTVFPFTFTSTSGAGTLETAVSHKKVKCESDTNEGNFSSATKGTVKVFFHGCKLSSKFPCQTGSTSGEIATSSLNATLGFINKAKKEVGIALAPSSGNIAEITCEIVIEKGETPTFEKVIVKESVIGAITKVETKTKTFTLTFAQTKGVQAVQNLEKEATDTLKASIDGEPFEEAGEETTDTLTTSVETEITA